MFIYTFNWVNFSITILKCKECQDASDEMVDNCASKCCPPFGFRCGYGACVDNEARCDGKTDCNFFFYKMHILKRFTSKFQFLNWISIEGFDESDENYLLCGYPESGRPRPQPQLTTSTTEKSIYDPNKIYFGPFDNIAPGKSHCGISVDKRN